MQEWVRFDRLSSSILAIVFNESKNDSRVFLLQSDIFNVPEITEGFA